MHKISFATSILVLIAQVVAAQTGAVSGRIADQTGSPLAGATVTYNRQPIYAPWPPKGLGQLDLGETYFSASATTDADGRYAIQGLPVGSYILCVSSPDQPILDPCRWSTPPLVKVAGSAPTVLDFAAARGVLLDVRLNDPLKLLPASEATPLTPAYVLVGVFFGTGAYLGASRASVDAAGQDYGMVIPTGVPLQLWILSGVVTLADTSGNALDNAGTTIPFQAVPGTDQAFTINVTGMVQPAAR